MDWNSQCLTEIGEFEVGRGMFYADMYSYPGNDGLQFLSYDIEYIPNAASYFLAQHTLSLLVAQNPQNVMTEVTADTSIAEFHASFEYDLEEYLDFHLYDESENWHGLGSMHEDLLPSFLTDSDGGECYVVVRLEYKHEYTKDTKELSEQKITQYRERIQKELTEWENGEW